MTKSPGDWPCPKCGRTYRSKHGLAVHRCRPPEFPCEFCGIKLTSEAFLINHVCERKRRFLERDTKAVKVAFMAYQRFYLKAMHRTKNLPDMASFEDSKLYAAFVRFARYLLDINPIDAMGFVDFLIRVEAKIDQWTHPKYYSRYIRELNKNEEPLQAIERGLLLMREWEIETGHDWHDFFRLLAPARAVLWILNGRISPWLLFTASSAKDLLERLNAEQWQIVSEAIDRDFWTARLKWHEEEVTNIRATFTEENI